MNGRSMLNSWNWSYCSMAYLCLIMVRVLIRSYLLRSQVMLMWVHWILPRLCSKYHRKDRPILATHEAYKLVLKCGVQINDILVLS